MITTTDIAVRTTIVVYTDIAMRRSKMNIDPDLGDLEEMLAHVQTQLEQEIDLEKESKMPSLINVQESPKMPKRNSSFNRSDSYDYRRPAPRPPLLRNNEVTGNYINGDNLDNGDYGQPNINRNGALRGSQSSLKSEEMGSQGSFQSFRSEPIQRHSVMSLPDKRGSTTSLNGKERNSTLPKRCASTTEKNWEDYWQL